LYLGDTQTRTQLGLLAIQTEVLHGFLESFRANIGILGEVLGLNLSGTPAIPTFVLDAFLQFFQANIGIVLQVTTTFFQILSSPLFILPFDAIWCRY
jgi:hypothetical protein